MKNIIALKNKLKNAHKQGLALDIDGVLSWTGAVWVKQLQKKFGNPENLTVAQIIKKYHFTKNIPYWQTPQVQIFKDKLEKSNDLQKNLPLIKDSPKFVQKINNLIPVVAYLSARPEIVTPSTQYWLKKHHFPLAPIINRPNNISSASGRKWKAKVLHLLYPQVLGIIDDNPQLIKFLPKDYQGIIFLYKNTNINQQNTHIIPCKTWPAVLKKVKQSYFKFSRN